MKVLTIVLTGTLVLTLTDTAATQDRNEPVYKIAEKYGFNHIGRFSSLYRAHFGAYPSTER